MHKSYRVEKQETEWHPGKRALNNFSKKSDSSGLPFRNNYFGGCVEEGLEGVEDRKRIIRQKDIASLVRDCGSLHQNNGIGEDEEENLEDP